MPRGLVYGDLGQESARAGPFHNMTHVPYWNGATVLFQNGSNRVKGRVEKAQLFKYTFFYAK